MHDQKTGINAETSQGGIRLPKQKDLHETWYLFSFNLEGTTTLY